MQQVGTNRRIAATFLRAGWKIPLLRILSSRHPVVLLYHGVSSHLTGSSLNAELFEQHVKFLKFYFELIPPCDLTNKRGRRDKVRILLTFDDGFRNNAEVVAPILRYYKVPALFFVCSRHAVAGKYLWFSYLRALEKHFPEDGLQFRGEILDMSQSKRTITLQRLRHVLLNLTPHPAAMYRAIEEELPRLEDFVDGREIVSEYAGMTSDHLVSLAADPLFSIGAHTLDHAFLTKSEPEEAFRQMSENKTWIEQVTNRPCDAIAYPSGDYDGRILDQCLALGFSKGYAVIPKLNIHYSLELPRLGIYSTGLDILGFKVQWGDWIRRLGLQVG
jgi:peptidoglycan/xylan/chitin deacetylase (PgdA/CDA1 family)